ncbi:TonB-dependent receptor [Kordiimonas pumila]|uniref:TonB-dependent receptor n=1 Tax=Kordiimonas pumila TaxID=2161677 RepID=A0ABV7D9W3_9PROT|nr:TonB-dependent receptor [Kordiimonas pumila]
MTKKSLLLAGACSALLSGAGLSAQAAEPSFDIGEEIVITAQRRETLLGKTPVSVTAFSGRQLQNAGIGTLDAVAIQTPNFNYVDTGLQPRYRIRGDGLQVFNDTSESPVGFAVDDIFYGAGALQRAPLYDINRVEVLRGPQGTLFGRNTTAGLVQVVTKKPTDTFEGYVQAGYGSFDDKRLEGAVSGPLADGVRGRVSFYYDKNDGWQKNLGIPGGVNWASRDVMSGRAQLGVDLGENATLLLKAAYTEDRSVAHSTGGQGTLEPGTFAPCATAQILANECVNGTGFSFGEPDPKVIYSDQDGLPNHLDFAEFSARLDWNITPYLQLVSITGYLDYDRIFAEDGDGSAQGGFLGNAEVPYTLDAQQFSQELQLRGGGDDEINWVVGGFYYNDDRTATSTVPEFLGDAIDTIGRIKTESGAVFASVNVPVTDTIGVEFGGRYTSEKKDLDLVFAFAPDANDGVKVDEFTWRVGTNWQMTDDVFLYANASTGYKSPDFNTTLLFGDATAAIPTQPEKSFSLEAGAKLKLGPRVNLSTAVFRNLVKDKQATVTQIVNALPVARLFNFGDVEIYGAELELSGRVTDQLSVMLGAAVLNTEIKADPTTTYSTGPASVATPIDGNELPATPHFTANGLIRYDFDPTSVGQFAVQADFNYTAKQFFQVDNNDRDFQKGYGIGNLRAFWHDNDDKFNVQVFVENVTNTQYASYVVTPNGFDTRYTWWGTPRTWGVRAGVNF